MMLRCFSLWECTGMRLRKNYYPRGGQKTISEHLKKV